jgi:nucleoside-diphosphate-sugar epimerase
MSNFIVNSLKDEPLKIYGNVEKTLDFTYIDDFIEGVMLTLNTKNKIYNISGEEELRVIDVAREILKQTNSPSKILFLDPEKAQPQKVKVNTNEIKAIGYSPKIKVSEGISKMISWYKTNKEALLSYKDEGEKYYNFIPEKESLK